MQSTAHLQGPRLDTRGEKKKTEVYAEAMNL